MSDGSRKDYCATACVASLFGAAGAAVGHFANLGIQRYVFDKDHISPAEQTLLAVAVIATAVVLGCMLGACLKHFCCSANVAATDKEAQGATAQSSLLRGAQNSGQ